MTRSTVASSGSAGARPAAGTTSSRSQAGSVADAGRAIARTAPSYPISISSTRRSVRSASVAAAVPKARVAHRRSGRRAPGAGPAAARRPVPIPAAGARTVSMPWPAGSPNSRLPLGHAAGEDEQPVRATHRRRRPRARPVRRSRFARPPRAGPRHRRGSRPCRHRGAAAVIASGSVVWALAATVRQPLRAAEATSGASDRSVAATIPSVRAGSERTSRRTRSAAATPVRPRRSTIAGSARVDPVQEDREGGLGPIDARQGDRADQPPGTTELADDGHGDGGGAEVDGREGARLAGHRRMLPGLTARRAEAPCRSVRRPRSSRRRSPRAA